MRVLFTATSYPTDLSDWRGLFIRHLAFALSRFPEIELRMWTPPGEYPEKATPQTTDSDNDWLASLMNVGGIAHLFRTRPHAAIIPVIGLLLRLRRTYRRSTQHDIYHLNWLQTALPLPRDGKPALITILGTDLNLLRLPLVKPLLRRVMHKRQVALCPNAEWMMEPLSESFGDLAFIKPVPFGIDPIWYEIKRSPDKLEPVWLAVTRLTRAKLGPLFTWAQPLFEGTGRQLHLFGPMQEIIEVPDWIEYHGPATPDELAKTWFPRAHGLITLSQHAEGRPQVMLEAMAAGLPIIASDIDAHRNFVEDEVTGKLCSSPSSLIEAIESLENLSENKRYGQSARDWATSRVGTWDDCANRYIDLYKKLSRPEVE